jgi:succinyl-CoA synthetase beta subunit
VQALRATPQLSVPVVARLVGNGLPAARAILTEAGIVLHTDLDDALREVRRLLAPAQREAAR